MSSSTSAEEETEPTMSSSGNNKTREVLEAAQQDLQNAEWDGVLGQFVGTVRSLLVRPVLDVTTTVLPHVAAQLPLLDETSAVVLDATFGLFRTAYTILPHVPSLGECAQEEVMDGAANARDLAAEEHGQVDDSTFVVKILSAPATAVSLAKAVLGYGINATLDMVTSPEDKMHQWEMTSAAFIGHLRQYGINEEVKRLVLNPRTDRNMVIMSRIQNSLDSMSDRRLQTSLKAPPVTGQVAKNLDRLASRFIKYSIAAYGVYMMESSNEARKVVSQLSSHPEGSGNNQSSSAFLREVGSLNMDGIMDAKLGRIAKFLNIDKQDIKYATKPGGGLTLLGHFVAVDHETKSVVLAIRGTHNTSEWVADFDAMAVPFCGGVAHKGMAERALNLWENRETRNAIARALYYNESYQLVVTGQSLGAGVANLINIKCHHQGEHLFEGKTTTCFAYGGPPVFAYAPGDHEEGILKAFASSYNYIHGKDVVAHVSLDSVRRVIRTLEDLDSLTSQLSPLDQFLLARGIEKPTDAMIQVVSNGSTNLEPMPGADRLKLPGRFVSWFKKVSNDPLEFDTCYCDPSGVSDLCIFLDVSMCTDHLPVAYEFALERIASSSDGS